MIFKIVLLILLISSCQIKKQAVVEINPLDYSDFIELKEPFQVTIIDYAKGCHCGTRACASICIGYTEEKDTFRVLSLCNTDTVFKPGMNVKVIPRQKPSFDVATPYYFISDSDSKEEPSLFLQAKRLKTLYGKLLIQ